MIRSSRGIHYRGCLATKLTTSPVTGCLATRTNHLWPAWRAGRGFPRRTERSRPETHTGKCRPTTSPRGVRTPGEGSLLALCTGVFRGSRKAKISLEKV